MENSLAFLSMADGTRLPSLGLGTWKIPQDALPTLIQEAIKAGYRHFDCACDYGNEAAVGEGLQAAFSQGLELRKNVWVTSKLWNTFHEPKHVRAACERSLRDLKLKELDLYLVHFPIALAYVPMEERYPPGWFFDPSAPQPVMKPVQVPIAETWGAMEDLRKAGLVKQIGVSNFPVSLLRDLLATCSTRPSVLQVELHPFLTQQRLLRFCREEGIAVTAFSPFGADSYLPLNMAKKDERLLDHPEITAIAKTHSKSPAQILLRWAVQRGTAAIPKTQSVEHLRENIRIFDFALESSEIARIDALNRHRRFNDPGEFCEAAFHSFFPIFD